MDRIFNTDLSESDLVDLLAEKTFKKIGEGFSAHVFGSTDMTVVIKVFPPLNVGGPEDVSFINKNLLLRKIERVTARWQNIKAVKWVRQKAKLLIAFIKCGSGPIQHYQAGDISINGYEACIGKGITKDFPTRIIPNCFSRLKIDSGKTLRRFYEKPEKIILQQQFQQDRLLINIIKQYAEDSDIRNCRKVLEDAKDYQLYLWQTGIADTDMSFNLFENLIMLPNGKLQLHDANDVTDSRPAAFWFIREKEKDITNIFKKLESQDGARLIDILNEHGISETARKLFGILPKEHKENIVGLFLESAREILSEKVMAEQWGSAPANSG